MLKNSKIKVMEEDLLNKSIAESLINAEILN